MKLQYIKQAGGVLHPADDHCSEAMTKFKTGEQYEIDIKLTRNPSFHRKVFSFFKFCFDHWAGGNEFQNETGQFDMFRKNLIVLAGYREEYYRIDGSVRVEARSIAFSNMQQSEFEDCYHALIQAAMTHIFHSADEKTYNRLIGFF